MTNPTSLSPAAQAVLDAFRAVPDLRDCPSIATHLEHRLIAALRAAADQLTPYSVEDVPGAAFCRNKLLSIAAELEAQ